MWIVYALTLTHGVSLSGPRHLPRSAFHFPNLCGLPLRLLRLVVPPSTTTQLSGGFGADGVRAGGREGGTEEGRKEGKKARWKEGRLKHVLGHVCRDRYAHIVLSSCCLQSRLAALIGFRRGRSLPPILPLRTVARLRAENLLLSIFDFKKVNAIVTLGAVQARAVNLKRRVAAATPCSIHGFARICDIISCNFNARALLRFYQQQKKTLTRRRRANSQTIYKYVLFPDADTPSSFPVTFH